MLKNKYDSLIMEMDNKVKLNASQFHEDHI